MYSDGIKQLPIERMIPLNRDDMMVIISPNLAFTLRNFSQYQSKRKFLISKIMETAPVFKCEKFDDRFHKESELFFTRIERFFETKKTDYIFFDKEEQMYLKDIFDKLDLICYVEIMQPGINGFEVVENILDVDIQIASRIIAQMNRMHIRVVLDSREYYNLLLTSQEKMGEKPIEGTLFNKFLKRYPKLRYIKTQRQFKNYFRVLAKRYHPDASQYPIKYSQWILEDKDLLVRSFWYKNLKI